MRIAYVAPYQGPSLVKGRPCLRNLSLAARVKIQLIAELLQRSSHEVEILSQGDVDRYELKYYPPLVEAERFHPDIPIYYTSAFPVRFLTGFWESFGAQRLLQARHALRRYDVVILYNMKRAQIGCARCAIRRLGLPVILEYEDDSFVNVHGNAPTGLIEKYHRHACQGALKSASGAMGVSPYLLSQFPAHIPKMLLRGVVSNEVVKWGQGTRASKKNWVVFSGTYEGTQGLARLIEAWRMLQLPDWELHMAGHGPLTAALEQLAAGDPRIVFHGLLNREQNAQLLSSAKIGMNPQDLTKRPGNVFPFKIIEYLAAGLHVISTPRGALEPELEVGVTYIPDNTPAIIADSLKTTIQSRRYEQTAEGAALQTYGPDAVSKSLNRLLEQVMTRPNREETVRQAGAIASADLR